MMKTIQVFLSAVFLSAVSCQISPRIAGGIELDTIRRFPQQVNIKLLDSKDPEHDTCSGSIISDQWILTSISCVGEASRIQLDFNRMHFDSDEGSFSVIIDSSYVTPYPTNYDDLALIKIPLALQLSSVVKAISLEKAEVRHDNQLAVMVGFNGNKTTLEYGMFRVLPTSECKKLHGSSFDDYLQICTQGWDNNQQVPCAGDQGGGLIIGWPHNPKLIGVFSSPLDCDSSVPAVYTRVSKYYTWINSVTGVPNKEETPAPA